MLDLRPRISRILRYRRLAYWQPRSECSMTGVPRGTTRIDIFSAETGPEAVRSGESHQPTMSRQNLSETSDR